MHRFLLLLLILGFCQYVYSAAIFEFPGLTRRLPERPKTPGCFYKGERYEHADRVETPEPCLNCTCIRGVLVCYLRVCPTASAPPPGCFPAREAGECCPTLICGGEDFSKQGNKSGSTPDLRPTFQPIKEGTTSSKIPASLGHFASSAQTASLGSKTLSATTSLLDHETPTTLTSSTSVTTPISTSSEDSSFIDSTEGDSLVYISSTQDADMTFFNDIPGGCLVNGTLYGDGSAMLSSSFCEYCFCIRGKSTCLQPKCHLVIDGCTPHYDTHFSCCPSRYDCSQRMSENDGSRTTELTTAAATSTLQPSTEQNGNSGECVVGGQLYFHGEVVSDYKSCHSCYCSDSSVVCEKIKCSPPIDGCHPIIPEGHCCPISYRCDYHHKNSAINSIKAASINNTALSAQNKKMDLKTVKQSEILKNESSSVTGEKSKITVNKGTDALRYNIIPIHRRIDEDESALNTTLIDLFSGGTISHQDITTQSTLLHARENDKTLNLELINDAETSPVTRDIGERLQMSTKQSSSQDRTEDVYTESVSVGLPEVHTISIQELFDQFFSRQQEKPGKFPGSPSFEPKRNNSKQPTSIVEIVEAEPAKPLSFTKDDMDKKPNISSGMEINAQKTVEASSTGYSPIAKTTNDLITDPETESISLTTVTFDTENSESEETSEEDDEILHRQEAGTNQSTAPPLTSIKILNNHSTFSTDKTDNSEMEHEENTESSEKLTERHEEMNDGDDELPENTEISIRHNSKLPAHSEKDDNDALFYSRYPLMQDAVVNLYFPAENREADSEKEDFTNVGSVYIGAPLSVDGTDERKGPDNDKGKTTESGGVIFMDPKYTDIDPHQALSEHISKIQANETEMDKSSEFLRKNLTTGNKTNEDVVNSELKKGPRIQDAYNHTITAQGYKIIPFVAEDAIRGHYAKGNQTFLIQQGSTEGLPDMVSDFCFINGRIYMNGEMIGKPDPCELCRCFYGRELCQIQRCPAPPDCIPERVPGFCCPRFTCGNNASSGEQIAKGQKVSSNIQTTPEAFIPVTKFMEGIVTEKEIPAHEVQKIKFGVRVRTRPPLRPTHHATRKNEFIKVTTSRPKYAEKTTSKEYEYINTNDKENNEQTTRRTPDYTRIATSMNVEYVRATEKRPDYMKTTTSTKPTDDHTTTTTTRKPDHIRTSKKPDFVKTATSQTDVIQKTTPASVFPDPWGLLKVSGCNIYGKFFNINDQVEILSGPCSHCICTTNGVECNDIC